MASADSEENFLKILEAGGFSWSTDSGGQALIDLGNNVCDGLASGTSAADIITQAAQETGWTPAQVGY